MSLFVLCFDFSEVNSVLCHQIIRLRVWACCLYRARQKNGSQVARIFQARPGRSGKQQQEQNSRNLGTVFFAGPCSKTWSSLNFTVFLINHTACTRFLDPPSFPSGPIKCMHTVCPFTQKRTRGRGQQKYQGVQVNLQEVA